MLLGPMSQGVPLPRKPLVTFPSQVQSDCSDLIGRPYKLGADGSGPEIDCIHLCYVALSRMGIETPPFKKSWYEAEEREIVRDILKWGFRVERPEYDGDILLLPQLNWAFAVTWQNGVLYINPQTMKVDWALAQAFTAPRCFRSNANS